MKVFASSFAVVKTFNLICASILMLGASVAFAEPALVITDFECVMIDGNGGFATGAGQVTKAANPNGNATLKCRASELSNDAGTEVKWDGENNPYGEIPCTSFALAEMTYDWKISVDTDGNGVMTCKFRDLY